MLVNGSLVGDTSETATAWEEQTEEVGGGGAVREEETVEVLGGGRMEEEEEKEEVPVSCSTLTGGLVAAFRDSISAWVIHTLLVD